MNIKRINILQEAFDKCLEELYNRSQPSVSYNVLLEKIESGELDNPDGTNGTTRICDRYYISYDEAKYVIEKYKAAYNIKETWSDWCDVMIKYLKEGGLKNSYVKDKNGGGHRSAEDTPALKDLVPLKEDIEAVIGCKITDSQYSSIIPNYDTVLELMESCKNFYRFDREESQFDMAIWLGPIPSSNSDEVVSYWKEQGIDLNIEERNPDLFYERDEYGDEFEDIMEDEYGPDWKQITDKEWHDRIAKQKEEKDKLYKALLKDE